MKADQAFQHLRNAFETERLAQAYIISGPPRTEGRAVADRVLQLLCCERRPRPCETCVPCTQAAAHTYPDFVWTEPEKKSRLISIEQVRALQKLVYQTSYAGGWKGCVLVGADRLGAPAANAFLKTLEEPPARCLFLLLTDTPQFLLPTIVSRCQSIALTSASAAPQGAWVTEAAAILGSLRGGSDATLAFAGADRFAAILKGLRDEASKEEKEARPPDDEDDDAFDARVESRYREKRKDVMRAMLLWHRDILLLACGADDTLIVFGDCLAVLRERAAHLKPQAALANLKAVEEMNRRLERSMLESAVLGLGFSQFV